MTRLPTVPVSPCCELFEVSFIEVWLNTLFRSTDSSTVRLQSRFWSSKPGPPSSSKVLWSEDVSTFHQTISTSSSPLLPQTHTHFTLSHSTFIFFCFFIKQSSHHLPYHHYLSISISFTRWFIQHPWNPIPFHNHRSKPSSHGSSSNNWSILSTIHQDEVSSLLFKSCIGLGSSLTLMKYDSMFQAVRDAMSIVLQKDDSALVFGEDVAFGGVFRWWSASHSSISLPYPSSLGGLFLQFSHQSMTMSSCPPPAPLCCWGLW